ncbi:hypothetical protein AFE_1594 [Acidithiobacillus ferrooxidans ATCC 23270]|uniref:Uncharacterized protein n=1 Tax=Acidithiobacillus ferrooxidans (strain ATCC 23270 / DSM 14882 / CIP 104768 / NCIMB 8455) TaxID=243159 RepID=B7JAT6_ACIF2|nr:hypothetical protein AFE_1594 [Acidithiobacillus ferrooxidans ATCC 23270]
MIQIGGRQFQVRYLKLQKTLPEWEITVSSAVGSYVASFRFTGGHGYLVEVR